MKLLLISLRYHNYSKNIQKKKKIIRNKEATKFQYQKK